MLQIDQPVRVMFRGGAEAPQVSEGEMETFIVVVRSAIDNRVRSFPADYLNKFPLWCEVPSLFCLLYSSHPHLQVDGCNATGWFDHIPDGIHGTIISPMYLNPGDELLGWCPVDEVCPALAAAA